MSNMQYEILLNRVGFGYAFNFRCLKSFKSSVTNSKTC